MTRSESVDGSRSLTGSCLPPLLIQLEEAEEQSHLPWRVTRGGERHTWRRAGGLGEQPLPPLRLQMEPNACGKGPHGVTW